MIEIIRTREAPLPMGIYSQATVSGGFVFVAGQAAINPETNQFEYGDIRSETERTLKNIQAILKAAGCTLKDVVQVGVFLSDMSDFEAMNEVYQRFFPQNPPARTTVGAQLPRIKVEIDCVAKLPNSQRQTTRRKGRTPRRR